MPDLLQSKLHLPRLRRAVLDRSRLLDRMSTAREVGLTLLSAPAGFLDAPATNNSMGGHADAARRTP